MNNDLAKQRMFEFLNGNELGVISTIHVESKGPESAVVGIGNTDQLELIFGTSAKTRKYKNIQHNPNVSFVVGWSSATGTLQYEGVARELTDDESPEFVELYMSKNESRKKFAATAEQRYFLVKPTWIRFQDNAAIPPMVHELNF